MICVRDEAELQAAIGRLLADPAAAAEMGRRAREVVVSRRGAMAQTVRLFAALLARA